MRARISLRPTLITSMRMVQPRLFNDATEGKAISALFNGVPVSSTKSMMGHSLGAAGAIEAVVCLLALQHQFLPANINFTAPDDDVDLNIVANEARPAA